MRACVCAAQPLALARPWTPCNCLAACHKLPLTLTLRHAAPVQSIFGVLHALAAVKYDSLLRFAAARLILDYLQLFLLLMRPAHGEQGPS